MQQYVAGFLIDLAGEAETIAGAAEATVALVRKNRPQWQAGKLNAVGGKIEAGESPADAMRREFLEETGLDLAQWEQFAIVEGGWGKVFFFRAFADSATGAPRTMEDEQIEVHRLDAVPYAECIPNLSWLIPLALYTHDDYAPVIATELEHPEKSRP